MTVTSSSSRTPTRPRIGITPDVEGDRYVLSRSYARMVSEVGGLPLMLPVTVADVNAYVALCDGFILSGGDDPDMRQWGIDMHPEAKAIDPDRQAFECALLAALDGDGSRPVLGVCLGMQLMALHAGGTLDQYLPDRLETAADHWGRTEHAVTGSLGSGVVHSHHRQAITDPGSLDVAAVAPDGVIEAVRDGSRRFYVGVQWHPERTSERGLGVDVVRALVEACR